MLWVMALAIKAIERYRLIEAQACHFVDGVGIDTVIIHVDFRSRDKESAGLMQNVEPAKIDIAAIHDIDSSSLGRDQIKRKRVAHFSVGNMDETGLGMGPRKSSSVCILIAAFVERKSAHGNSDKHRSMVVLSSA